MEDISGSSAPASLSTCRLQDDRASSDSGVSSRGGSSSGSSGSSDERSGSRSSALSVGLDEGSPYHSRKSPNAGATSAFYHPSAASLNSINVWRDPNLLLVAERSIRHVDSVQHQSLLMSHPAVAAGSPSSSSSASIVSPSSVAAPSTPVSHYPPTGLPMITPHPLHHQLPPPSIYTTQIPEMLWKQQRFPGLPMTPAHLHPAAAEELAYAHDRERQDRLQR